VIRLPDDKRPKLLRRASLDLLRLNEAVVAAEFVFTTIGIGLFFLDLIDDFHVAGNCSYEERARFVFWKVQVDIFLYLKVVVWILNYRGTMTMFLSCSMVKLISEYGFSIISIGRFASIRRLLLRRMPLRNEDGDIGLNLVSG